MVIHEAWKIKRQGFLSDLSEIPTLTFLTSTHLHVLLIFFRAANPLRILESIHVSLFHSVFLYAVHCLHLLSTIHLMLALLNIIDITKPKNSGGSLETSSIRSISSQPISGYKNPIRSKD